MVQFEDGTFDFFTPLDIPPVEKQHEHKWQIAEIEKGKTVYEGMAVDTGILEYAMVKKPDTARYICDCGESKKVKIKVGA